ncbi:MAG: HpcH/HpaI aldolase/citrate lyase family protein [Mycobacterium sp.]
MTAATPRTSTAKSIKHFRYLAPATMQRLFHLEPELLTEHSDPRLLGLSLGATLYMPADRTDLAATVTRRMTDGVCSMVLDLEDAVSDQGLGTATQNVVDVLNELARSGKSGAAQLFVRVRTPEGVGQICDDLSDGVDALSGFVFPKFTARDGEAYLRAVTNAGAQLDRKLFCMPVLETGDVVHRPTRDIELTALRALFEAHREIVLAVRVGATDLCGMYGIRRDRDLTIYDVNVVASAIGDIVNYLGRADGTGHIITGPVWEYFADHERLFRPMLRATPFVEHDAVRFREHLVSRDLDGLLRELVLDRTNGMYGKTVIHPSHVAAVHALAVVTHEEYRDAADVLASTAGGVRASEYRNKMNEARPHRAWAEHVLRRSQVFGVAAPGVTIVDLLTALAVR